MRKYRFHYKSVKRTDPAVKPWKEWLPVNRAFYDRFRKWLREGGYSRSSIDIYGSAVRLALGWLDKPFWEIDPRADIERVTEYLDTHYERASTRQDYGKGLKKLAEFLRIKCHRPEPVRQTNWAYYVGSLPDWLVSDVKEYIAHRRRAWKPDRRHRATDTTLSHLTLSLRWMAVHAPLSHIGDLAPDRWFAYVDARLADGISVTTLNGELGELQFFVRYLADLERPVCARMLRVQPLKQEVRIPRDVPVEQLRLLRQEIEADAADPHAGIRRMGIMDRAWFLFMLHSGLRSSEIRRLRRSDVDIQSKRVRVEQAKGFRDRIVYLSEATVAALEAYLAVRGPAETDHVFAFRHRPLSVSYFGQRMGTYCCRCGIKATPHQLRHSCATLLLNAGAPVLTVQRILGHKYIDTTLGYARLYDGTVAADYYRAMAEVESRLALAEGVVGEAAGSGELLAMVDALRTGTLNEKQREVVQALRAAIMTLDSDTSSAGNHGST
jgi:integrase/recombinase XerD